MDEFWSIKCEDPKVQGESSSGVMFPSLYGLRDDITGKMSARILSNHCMNKLELNKQRYWPWSRILKFSLDYWTLFKIDMMLHHVDIVSEFFYICFSCFLELRWERLISDLFHLQWRRMRMAYPNFSTIVSKCVLLEVEYFGSNCFCLRRVHYISSGIPSLKLPNISWVVEFCQAQSFNKANIVSQTCQLALDSAFT